MFLHVNILLRVKLWRPLGLNFERADGVILQFVCFGVVTCGFERELKEFYYAVLRLRCVGC